MHSSEMKRELSAWLLSVRCTTNEVENQKLRDARDQKIK